MKDLYWVGSSLSDLKSFPSAVCHEIGFALHLAQEGEKHCDAKPLKGFSGAGVLEVVTNKQSDTYRTIYTVKFKDTIYVLHAFQKKSKKGIATPKKEIDLLKKRLLQANDHYKELTSD